MNRYSTPYEYRPSWALPDAAFALLSNPAHSLHMSCLPWSPGFPMLSKAEPSMRTATTLALRRGEPHAISIGARPPTRQMPSPVYARPRSMDESDDSRVPPDVRKLHHETAQRGHLEYHTQRPEALSRRAERRLVSATRVLKRGRVIFLPPWLLLGGIILISSF